MRGSRMLTKGCRGLLITLLAAGGATISGCADDPCSQRRIGMRWSNFNELAGDLARHEALRPAKVEAAIRTVERKWYSDLARFNEVAPQVGDYVW